MNTKELIPGGYFQTNKYGSIAQIQYILGTEMVSMCNNYEDFELNTSELIPIKLTEQWLQSFSLEKDKEAEYLKENFDSDCSFYINNPNIPFNYIDLVNGSWFFRTPEGESYPAPQFVHLFQNWWYFNTHESLKRNDDKEILHELLFKNKPISYNDSDCYANWYDCPICKIDYIKEGSNYCPGCGVKLCWE